MEQGDGPRSPELPQADRPLAAVQTQPPSAYRDSNAVAHDYSQASRLRDLSRFGQTVEQVFVQALVA